MKILLSSLYHDAFAKSLNALMPKKIGMLLVLSILITIFLLIRIFVLNKKKEKKKEENVVKESLQ